jgi:hypothetical protein
LLETPVFPVFLRIWNGKIGLDLRVVPVMPRMPLIPKLRRGAENPEIIASGAIVGWRSPCDRSLTSFCWFAGRAA